MPGPDMQSGPPERGTRRHRASADITLLDLRDDFPELAPSEVARVIESLARRGLVSRVGDFERVYLGGVTFSPGKLGEGSYDLPT